MKEIRIDLKNNNNLSLNLRNNKALSLGSTSIPCMNVVEAKIDTTENWDLRTTYVPKRGVLIIYSDKWKDISGNDVPGIKVGDGNAFVVDLPFLGTETNQQLIDLINSHINNIEIHVSDEDREFWNNKLNVNLNGETLELNRL